MPALLDLSWLKFGATAGRVMIVRPSRGSFATGHCRSGRCARLRVCGSSLPFLRPEPGRAPPMPERFGFQRIIWLFCQLISYREDLLRLSRFAATPLLSAILT